jgi:hypothetical protein
MRWRRISAALGLALLARTSPASAQGEAIAQLPDSVAHRVVAFFNATSTIRLAGESRLPAGATVAGDLAVLGGPLILGGQVDGDVVVINGDLRLESGARITGRATVVGGSVSGEPQATVTRGLDVHPEPLRFRQDASGLVYAPPAPSELSAGREFGFGRTDLRVAARRDYNRVEGLPISLGPRLRFGRSNPTVVDGQVIYRTAAGLGLDTDRLGYGLRVEQYLGGGGSARFGLRVFSDIEPIERRGISDLENSLSTFVLHRDLRDSYQREGWAAWLRYARAGWPADVTLEYRDERHGSVTPASPWSLFDNEEPWRPEPLIAEGTLRSLAARFVYDTRNEAADPAAGWHITAEVEQGLGGVLRRPAAREFGEIADSVDVLAARERFTHVSIDIRNYFRFGPGSRMALRAYGSGSANGAALPAQRQHALGGEGSLEGYSPLAFDCGARDAQLVAGGDAFHPYYGCDRVALVQLEYQAAFPFLARQFGAFGRRYDLEHLVRGVVFFDAGRAWNEPDALDGRKRGQTDFAADAGFGVRVGPVGIYWGFPLSSEGQGGNFFVRLGRRL